MQFASDLEFNPGFNMCVRLQLIILEIGRFWWPIVRNQSCLLFLVLFRKEFTE